MTFSDDVFQQLLRFLEQRPERLAELRRLVVADELGLPIRAIQQLAEAQARTEQHLAGLTARVDRLAEAQVRTEQRLEQLAEAQRRTEQQLANLTAHVASLTARVDSLATRMDQLAEAQIRTEATLRELVDWQKGERNQRAGERYEQDIVREALALFAGGAGGSPAEPQVRLRLGELLADILAAEVIRAEANPLLADLIWWKGGQFVLAEVSLVVGMSDVARAAQRAETLRQAGPERGVEGVLAIAIGRRWSGADARLEAELLGVASWIRDEKEPSPEILAYRRLRPPAS